MRCIRGPSPLSRLLLRVAVLALGSAAAISPLAVAPRAAAGGSAHSPSSIPLPTTGAWFGATTGMNNDQISDPAIELSAHQALVGRKFAVVRIYHAWDEAFPTDYDYYLKSQGQIPLMSWNSGMVDGLSYALWSDIGSGLYDSTIDARAADIKAYGGQVYLTFHHEPEPKQGSPNYGTPAEFVAAWKHIHDRFSSDGVTNVSWVLILVNTSYSSAVADTYYHGDSDVDILGADGYNWYGCAAHPTADWRPFSDIFDGFYNYGIAKGKSMFVAEYGTGEDSADPTRKAQWFTDAAATIKTWPSMKAVLYYDHNEDDTCDFWVGSSDASLASYQALGADPYLNPLPPLAWFSSGPASSTNSTTATFVFTSNIEGSTFTCALDSGIATSCNSPNTYGDLSNGLHTASVITTDLVSGQSGPATYTWTVDTAPPTVTFTAAPQGYTTSTTATFRFEADEDSTFICQLDSGAASACSPPATYTDLLDGPHTFTVTATDLAGNASAPTTYTWTVDTVPPTVTITSGPPPLSNSKTATFTFTSNEQGATFKCSKDGSSYVTCSSPRTYTWLTDGAHSFSAEAIDLALNTSAPASWTWSVDTVKPVVTITSQPANPSKSKTASFIFSVTDSLTVTSTCQLDATPATPCGPGVSAGYASDTFTRSLTDTWGSTYEGSAWAYTSGAKADFDVNGSAGTANLGVVNSPRLAYLPQLWTDSEVLVRFQVDKMPTNNRVNVYVVGRYDSAVNGPFYTVRAAYLPTGTMMIAATKKAAGGAEAQIGTEVNIGSIGLANTWYWIRARFVNEGNSVRIQGRAWKDGTPEPTTYQLSYLDSTSPIMTAGRDGLRASPSATNTPFLLSWDDLSASAGTTYANLSDAQHTFTVTSTDSAGNVGTGVSSWTVDTVLPVATITSSPSNPSNSTSATLKFGSSETGSTFSCRLDSGAPTTCTSPFSYTGLLDGSHTFTVTATDRAGNVSVPATYTWTVDTVPPIATITSSPPSLTNSKTATFTFIANELGSTFKCSKDGASYGSCTSPKTYTLLSEGSHTFSVEAIDPAGNTGGPATYTWTIDVTKPVTTITSGPANPTSSTTATFTFTASEGGVTFSCQLDSGTVSSCTSPKTYTGLAPGQHFFYVYATDQAGNVGSTAQWKWTIQ
jgi:hypothetical protein